MEVQPKIRERWLLLAQPWILDTLTWSIESSFKFIDYATQLVDHYKTLDCGGQPKTDEEKIIKLLDLMNTNSGFLLT